MGQSTKRDKAASPRSRAAARSFTREGHPPAFPISLARRGNKERSTGVSPVRYTRVASSSMTNHALRLHGRDDHAPLFRAPARQRALKT